MNPNTPTFSFHPVSHFRSSSSSLSFLLQTFELTDSLSLSSGELFSMKTAPLLYAGCVDYLLPEPHFLDSCSLCRKPLGSNSDIFMYRGNTPFCSKDCRQEQIDVDEAKEKIWRRSSSSSSAQSRSKKESAKKTVRSGTVAVA